MSPTNTKMHNHNLLTSAGIVWGGGGHHTFMAGFNAHSLLSTVCVHSAWTIKQHSEGKHKHCYPQSDVTFFSKVASFMAESLAN
jgi:hypothetical protein